MTERQRDILDSLRVFCGDDPNAWARPMDIGARDGSAHTAILRALIAKGFVARRLRGSLLNHIRGSDLYERLAKRKRGRHAPRGSYVYQITELGRAALAAAE